MSDAPRDRRVSGLRVIPTGACDGLNERQLTDFADTHERFLKWCLAHGKNPDRGDGYSKTTIRPRWNRIVRFYEHVWTDEGRYTTDVTHTHADEYIDTLAYDETVGQDHVANTQKAIKMLFKWRARRRGGDEWEPRVTVSNTNAGNAKQDFLTREERDKLRDAALSYGTLPNYNTVSPDERDRVKRYLAQQFGIPVGDVGRDHWERASGWKYPSLVFVSLDIGARPVEIERMDVDWFDLDNAVVNIPADATDKDAAEWQSSLSQRTVDTVRRWLRERECYEVYDDTDAVWVTKYGNRYDRQALRYVIERLLDEAGIETRNREVGWYLIRRSTATYLVDEADLSDARDQLRHHNIETTARYDQTPPERRRDYVEQL